MLEGRICKIVEQDMIVGNFYTLKLVHIVDIKFHSRATGPYALITKQPVRGRGRKGGQRVGEMEIWAFEGFGISFSLHEILTVKSDDLIGREFSFFIILTRNHPLFSQLPDSFRMINCELQSICLDIFFISLPYFYLLIPHLWKKRDFL